MNKEMELWPCPSCGFLKFSDPPGTYEICDICGWEDDPVQLMHPLMSGGANQVCLAESQQQLLKRIPKDVREFNGARRDTDWRPLTPDELETINAPSDGLSYFETASDCEPGYYWKATK